MLTRRRWLATSVRGITGTIVWRSAGGRAAAGQERSEKTVSIVEFSQAGDRREVTKVAVLVKSEQEWRDQLSPLAFEVTRRAATERPFTGVYWNSRDKGLYRCICCDTAVFGSDKKFHSDTGWPSFWAPLAKQNTREHPDLRFGMSRVAVWCRRCEAHLGHVFDDGPNPTGLRYCINSVALRFVPA